MTLTLPLLYHWSPTSVREKIIRRGLLPRTLAARFIVTTHDNEGKLQETPPPLTHQTTWVEGVEDYSVCLAATPWDGWVLSGAISGEPGESWDLWQVVLDDEDEVQVRDLRGPNWDEVRVFNRIPKSRVWYVASRVVSPHERRKL